MLKKEYVGCRSRQNQPYPSLGQYLATIDKWLVDDKEIPKKQRHTGIRIYNLLQNEKGYQESIATVLRYVRMARQRIGIGGKQVFIPLDKR